MPNAQGQIKTCVDWLVEKVRDVPGDFAAFDAKDFIEAAVGNPNFTRARIERCLASATCKKAWPV